MKAALVSHSDAGGGAARAALRVHQALSDQGVLSRLMVLDRRTTRPDVEAPLGWTSRVVHRLAMRFERTVAARQLSENPVSRSLNLTPSGMRRCIDRLGVDVVNLHWVGHGTLSLGEIARVRAPILWTLHDMWAFSGAEHYESVTYPGRYRTDYAPATRAPEDRGLDIDAWTWRRKRRIWKSLDPIFICPSDWLADCVKNSSLFGNATVRVIEYPLDLGLFHPLPKPVARAALNLPADGRVVTFGALSAREDQRKGFDVLQSALREFAKSAEGRRAIALVFGTDEPDPPPDLGMPALYLGHLDDATHLRTVYSAADVMIVPSYQENLPQTATEALACGTPVAAFGATGLASTVKDGTTGKLAHPYDPESLAQAILWILQDEHRHRKLCETARGDAVARFSPDTVAKQYLGLFEEAIVRSSSVRGSQS